MDRHPLLGDHGRGEPAPETEKMGEDGMEIHATMRLAAMQVQRHRKNGELRNHHEVHQQTDPRGIRKTVTEEIQNSKKHGMNRRNEDGLSSWIIRQANNSSQLHKSRFRKLYIGALRICASWRRATPRKLRYIGYILASPSE
jgi:hypothetical protein